MKVYPSQRNRTLESAADRARRFRWRIRALIGFFVVLYTILALRAVELMAFSGERLERLAKRQHQQVVTLYPKRGPILDRNGDELAMSVEMDSLYADPSRIDDPKKTAHLLAPLLKTDEKTLAARLSRKLRFVWLSRRMGQKQARAILDLKLPGIYTVVETRRFYPNRELAGPVLGFTNIDNLGLEGLERVYNDRLNGKISRYIRLRDARGRNITPKGVLVRQNRDGGSIVLTLDLTLQYAADKALQDAWRTYHAKSAFAIVLDAHTGEILALANAPGFNPNAYGRFEARAFKNRAVANAFEPGSTQKPFLIAAALDEGVIDADERIDCEHGRYRIGRNVVHDTHEYDWLSIEEIIKYSSNVGASKIAERLGKQAIYDYYRAFGFGTSTKSGLPGEVNGLLRPPRRWSRIGVATHGFGQGMSVTGMQIASALTALTNGGVRMKPFIVKEIRDSNGMTLQHFEPEPVGRVLKARTARLIADFMTSVTRKGGTGTKAAIAGYPVAGKTGTAQKVDPKTHRYGRGMYTSSFVGFVPADDPALIIVVVMGEPRGNGHYGGTVAAPVFAAIAETGMRHLGIPPRPETAPTPDDEAAPAPDKESPVDRIVRRSDEGTPAPTEPALEWVTQSDDGDDDAFIVPDFTGRPMRSVLAMLDDKLLKLHIEGSGIAVAQRPKAGETLRPGDEVHVTFSPDGTRDKGRGGTATHRSRRHP